MKILFAVPAPILVCPKIKSEFDLLFDIGFQLGDRDTNLLHGVAVADGNAVVCLLGIVANRFKVDGDAKGCSDVSSFGM